MRPLSGHLAASLPSVHRVFSTHVEPHLGVLIEHAIGGMKRYNILVHTFRNRIEHFEDDVIGICAGLWNLVLSY